MRSRRPSRARASKQTTQGSQEQTENDSGFEDQHGVLVFEAKSRHDAEPYPEFRVAGFHNVYQQPGAAHPEERLECVHGQQVVASEDTRRDEGNQGREALGKALAAKCASDQCSERYLARSGQAGQGADRRK